MTLNVEQMTEIELRAHAYTNPCPIARYEAAAELARRGVILP